MQKSIEITTTQNVTIEYELAKLRERGLAWLIDVLIIAFSSLIVVKLMFSILDTWSDGADEWSIFVTLLPVLGYFVYHILFEIMNVGQSPGKMIMGVKVVRLDGKEPEWSDVMLRSVLHVVDSLFSFCVIGVVLIKTTGKGQRLGDMAANTTVIKIQGSPYQYRLQDILSISTMHNYQPVYPQARRLSEQDMLYIKSTLLRLQKYPNQAHEELVEDLVSHLMPLLDIQQRPVNRVDFLRTLLRDYVVQTR